MRLKFNTAINIAAYSSEPERTKMKPTAAKFISRPFHCATAIICSYLVAIYPVMAQQGQQAETAVQQSVIEDSDLEAPKIPDDQLDSLVAPIALYPDPLLAQTLAASTYPLEVIQLQQWLAKNPDLKGQALADAVQKQNWDPSIQATAALPDVVKLLSDDITWTTDLGNAFLAQQADVMAAVQRMRLKAQGKGTLQTSQQQVVKTEEVEGKSVVVVEQADPEVVYVPSYNPTIVYGEPVYPYPSIYYPPVGAYVTGTAIAFGVGIAVGAAWHGGWGWGCGWGHNDINVNVHNNYVNNYNRRNNIHTNNNNWQHHPQHRGGAPYPNRNVSNKYPGAGNRPGASNRPGSGAGNVNRPGSGTANRPGSGTTNHPGGGKANRPGQGGSGDRQRPGQGGSGDRQRPGQGQAGNRPGSGGSGDRQRPSGGSAKRPSGGGASTRPASRPSGSANHIGNRNISKPSSGRSKSAFNSGGGSRSSARASHSRGSRSMSGGHRGGGRRR
jgi:Protein of unknown function (DUF3300)